MSALQNHHYTDFEEEEQSVVISDTHDERTIVENKNVMEKELVAVQGILENINQTLSGTSTYSGK